MKTIAKLTLAATALLSASAFAADIEDPVLASFERDMYREPCTHAVQAVFVDDDLLAESFYVALQGPRKPETRTVFATADLSGFGSLRNGS